MTQTTAFEPPQSRLVLSACPASRSLSLSLYVCVCAPKRNVLDIMLTSDTPKVGYLALPEVVGHEHVRRLYVSVRKAHLVHELQT